jgi:hypothetical protein
LHNNQLLLLPLSIIIWNKSGLFIIRVKNDTRNREIIYELSSKASIDFSPFENIAHEIRDNRKIIGMHNSALNQNLEGPRKLFGGRGSPPIYFSSNGHGEMAMINFC